MKVHVEELFHEVVDLAGEARAGISKGFFVVKVIWTKLSKRIQQAVKKLDSGSLPHNTFVSRQLVAAQ